MTWESIVEGALQGISSFVNSFTNIIGGALNSAAVEGIVALTAIAVIISIFEGRTKIRVPKIPKFRRDDDDDDEYEYIKVRRQKR